MSQAGVINTNAGNIESLAGDTGTATGATIGILTNGHCGSTVKTSASGSTVLISDTDSNNNIAVGNSAGNSSISGTENCAFGFAAMNSLTTGDTNALFGNYAGTALTTGSYNTAIGYTPMSICKTGQYNIAIGPGAGNFWTTSESNNIAIQNDGVGSENNTIHIGTQGSGTGQQNACYIAGISGVTGTSSAVVVGLNTSTTQLLQTTMTAGSGISVTPGAGTITISATGSERPWTDEGASFSAVSGNGYFVTATATATLPASPSQGSVVQFAVDGTQLLTVTANTGQIIRIGSSVSASAGTAVNTSQGDSVSFVFRSSDSAWIATSVIGTWTVT